jgi:hypothetical protein
MSIVCDDCGTGLRIDRADTARKGFHVWWADQEVLYELHLHKRCAAMLGIQ